MKALIQRVSRASVNVDGETVGSIGKGLMILVGIAETDRPDDIDFVADKCLNLRIFEDEEGKMNRSLLEVDGEILAISQFTLLADTRKGRRPSFIHAANPEKGEQFYRDFCNRLRRAGVNVETGVFGAMMDVDICNYGPVTVMVESKPTD